MMRSDRAVDLGPVPLIPQISEHHPERRVDRAVQGCVLGTSQAGSKFNLVGSWPCEVANWEHDA